jgi:hypothetical protein
MSHGIVSACGGWALLLAMAVMTGCSKERDPLQVSTAVAKSIDVPLLLETYGEDERETIRVRTDTARGRLWVYGFDHVRVYDTVTKKLIRQITLPRWFVKEAACMPDLILDRSGSAFISSNVMPALWRIDADSFEVSEHEVSLQGNEQWDTGFGALALGDDGNLYALTSSLGSLWKIDLAKASARMIHLNHPPIKECAYTTQFLKDFETSQKPWTRPLPQQN